MSARQPDPSKPFLVGDTLAAIFAEAGISFGRRAIPAPGAQAKLRCPACEGGRTRELSLSLKVDADGQGATWQCFRGGCPGSRLVPGNGRIEAADAQRPGPPLRTRERPPAVKPMPHSAAEQLRPLSLYDFFAKRSISAETVDAFGIYAVVQRWPQLDEAGKPVPTPDGQDIVWIDKPTIVFPYRWRGELVSRKFRSPQKQFKQDRDSLRALFNADAIETPDEVILVEGEMDVLALWEAGYRQVVSLPDGAPSKLYDEDDPKREDDRRFDALETCAEKLADVKRVIIATDGDVPGGYLAEEFARRLGRLRCWRAIWPDGCKDANDVLMRHGADALRAAIAAASPWPLAGIWQPKPGALREFLVAGKRPDGLESGIRALDEVAKIPAEPGRLMVITGVPAHGKTSVLSPWLAYVAQRHDRGIVWCSPEDGRPEVAALRLIEVLAGQPAEEAGSYMPEEIMARHEAWLRERVTFLWSDDPDVEMTIDWVLARAEEVKRRQRRDFLVLDPWSDFEHQMARNESETQYINRTLIRMKKWGRAEGMGIIIAAHPQKLQKDPKSKKWPVANGYDISGSANWFNRADLGVTIYRAEEGITEVHNWKAKFRTFGTQFGKARLKLDCRTGRISSAGTADDTTGEEAEHGSEG